MLVRNKGKYFVILLTFTFSEIKKRRQRQTGTEEEMEVLENQQDKAEGLSKEENNFLRLYYTCQKIEETN